MQSGSAGISRQVLQPRQYRHYPGCLRRVLIGGSVENADGMVYFKQMVLPHA